MKIPSNLTSEDYYIEKTLTARAASLPY